MTLYDPICESVARNSDVRFSNAHCQGLAVCAEAVPESSVTLPLGGSVGPNAIKP